MRALPVACLASLVLGCAAGPPAEPEATSEVFYELLARCAAEPGQRRAVLQIVADDLQPAGRELAVAYRRDPDAAVRKSCYVWLLSSGAAPRGDWLAEGLADQDPGVQAQCLVRAAGMPSYRWSADARMAVQGILWDCAQGHVFDLAAHATVKAHGRREARNVFEIVGRRGAGWAPFAMRALALWPDEDFRALFSELAEGDDEDVALLARRALLELETGRVPSLQSLGELTVREFHARWQADRSDDAPPQVVERGALLRELRTSRVVVVGELHASMPARAAQIELLAELHAVHGDRLVLVCERPVLEYQQPLIAAAEQYAIEWLCLEDYQQAFDHGPDRRDRAVRAALVELVRQRPDAVVLVCYGANHLRGFRAALRGAGLDCAAVWLTPDDGMLATALRLTGGDLAGKALRYPDDEWYLPVGSLAELTGSQELDEAFSGHR